MLVDERLSRNEGLAPAFAAMRTRLAVVTLLFALAGIGWWWTAGQMRGMDDGPWTGLGVLPTDLVDAEIPDEVSPQGRWSCLHTTLAKEAHRAP